MSGKSFELATSQLLGQSHQHAASAVACSTAAQTDYKVSATLVHGSQKQFAHTIGGGLQRVALVL